MSDLRKIVAKEMSKSNGKAKVMRGNVFNINILDEWIKWLSYESVEDKKIRDSICEFYDTLFNEDNYPKLSKYFDLNRMRDLFIRYNEGDVSDEEYLEVVAYMGEDIFELMDYKLTSDEKEEVRRKIDEYKKLDTKELGKIVKEQNSNYKDLSMVDSYVLHVIFDEYNYRCSIETDKLIQAQVESNHRVKDDIVYKKCR